MSLRYDEGWCLRCEGVFPVAPDDETTRYCHDCAHAIILTSEARLAAADALADAGSSLGMRCPRWNMTRPACGACHWCLFATALAAYRMASKEPT